MALTASCALLSFAPSVSMAQDAESAEQRAIDLFMEAEQAYEGGEIERAVDLLLEARRLRREPVLLYNLARAYETLGRLDEAVEAYEAYLLEAPEAIHRGAIETRTSALRRQIEERERLEEERDEARDAPPPQAGPSLFPWIVLGAGIATLGSAIVFGLLSADAREEAVQDRFYASAFGSYTRAQDFALVANVLYAVGGAASLAAAIWGVVDLATANLGGDAEVAFRVHPGGLLLTGRW